VVDRGDGRIQSDRAVYAKSADTVVFTGNPRWNQDQTEGRADRVTVHSQTGEIHAEDNVDVKVPLNDQGASLLTFLPDAADTNRGPQVVEVFAAQFDAKGRQAIFSGSVRAYELPITGSEPRLRSDSLEVQLAADRRHAESIAAKQHVVFERGTPGVTNGPAIYRKLTASTLTAQPSPQAGRAADLVADGDVRFDEPGRSGRGGHATYTGATDIMELTGNPVVETPQGTVTGASVLIWDRANDRLSATGLYKIEPPPDAGKPSDEESASLK
jgi:lipopolysaccharide export system protein LptA